MFTKKTNKIALIYLVLLVGFVMAIYSLNLVLVIISLIFTYKLTDKLLSRKIFDSKLFTALVSLFVYMVILQSVITLSWLLNVNFPLHLCIALSLLTITPLYFAFCKDSKACSTNGKSTTNKFDIISIVISLAIFVPIVLQSLQLNGVFMSGDFISLGSYIDDVNFLPMFNVRVKYDRGVLYKSDAASHLAFDSDAYPAGWVSANAVISKSVFPKISIGTTIDRGTPIAYTISKLFWVFTLLFMFCRTIIALIKGLSANKRTFLSSIWIIASLYIYGRYFVADVYKAGAYSFIPQLLSVLLVILMILQLNKCKEAVCKNKTLVLLSLFAIGGSLSWLLVLPAVVASIIAIWLSQIKDRGDVSVVQQIFRQPKYTLPLILTLGASLTQAYITTAYRPTGPRAITFVSGVSTWGIITTYSALFYVVMAAGLVAFLWFLRKRQQRYIKYFLWTLAPLVVFDLIILAIQLINVGEIRYYFIKVLALIGMVVIPLTIAGFTYLLEYLHKTKRSTLEIVALAVLLVLVAVQFLAQIMCTIG